jgi:acetyl-CoA acyltransferase
LPALNPEQVEDLILGCAFPEAEQGFNLARVVVHRAGLPDSVAGMTINRLCSSGLQAIALASQAIATGQAEVVIAGGVESMSLIPMGGQRFMPSPSLFVDYPQVYATMGHTAERVATQYQISREDQDGFALRSHQRAIAAIEQGRFTSELIPLTVRQDYYQDGQIHRQERALSVDEGPRADTSLAALAALPPVFQANGTVTAGNSSQTSDGAAASVLVSERVMNQLNLKPLGRLIGFAVSGVEPELMGMGPVLAIPKVLQQVGLTLADIGLIELNEAFAAQALAVIRKLGLDEALVNVNGGAIALGHPLGCSGSRLTTTLLYEMQRRGVRYGLVSLCVGGGMGVAGVLEAV